MPDSTREASRIRNLLDAAELDYLRRRHRGGIAGRKGLRCEDVFASVQIAEAARRHGADCDQVWIEGQPEWAFVDDLRINDRVSATSTHFQLKNVGQLAWSSGAGSLGDDCARQHDLCSRLGEAGACEVVTSEREVAHRLDGSMPQALRAFTRVRWFPWLEPLPRLCAEHLPEFSALVWLSKHAQPNAHDVVEVLGVLCGAWMQYSDAANAAELIAVARKSAPALIRPLVSDVEAEAALQPEFISALAAVPGFSCRVAKGFLAWEMHHPNGAYDSGVLPYDCLSMQFQALQSRVLRLSPLTFESLEDQLV